MFSRNRQILNLGLLSCDFIKKLTKITIVLPYREDESNSGSKRHGTWPLLFTRVEILFMRIFYQRVRRLKVGKAQLPVITTSAEEEDVRGCGAEANRKERNRAEHASDTQETTAAATTTTVASEVIANDDATSDFPNFASALQLADDRPGVPNRPIYPNIPYSPYSSPRTVRRKSPLKESRRVSIDKCGTYQQLNQYKLIDSIGQVRYC